MTSLENLKVGPLLNSFSGILSTCDDLILPNEFADYTPTVPFISEVDLSY